MKQELLLKGLGEICHFVRGPFGGSLKKSCFEKDGNAVYEQQHAIYNQFNKIRYYVNDIKFEEMKRFELLAGDLIMSCSGTMGKVAIVPDNIKRGIINQALLKLTPSNHLNVEYLKYWMTSNDFQKSLAKHTVGAAIKNVASVKVLKQIEIPLPPLPEQKRIVAILDKAFAAIAKAKANAEQNLKNAKELFESYLQGVFENKGEDWEELTIEKVCLELFAGGDAPKGNYSKEKNEKYRIPIYANAVKDNGLYGFTNFSRVNKPSITIAARGSGTGHTEIRYEQFLPIVRLIVLIPNLSLIILEFLKYSIDNLEILRSGSAIPQLTVPMMKKYTIPLPPLTAQKHILKRLHALSIETKKLEAKYQQKIEDLEELKKSILQKAFNGEL